MGKGKELMAKKVWTVLLNGLLVLLLLVGVLTGVSMLPIEGNYQLLAVKGGSMAPTIPLGSVVVIKPVEKYRVGDVISFLPPTAKTDKDYTTHRIVEEKQAGEETVFVTRGDANNAVDADLVTADRIAGRQFMAIPFVGHLLNFIKTLPGLIIVIIIPAAIIIFEESHKIRKEIRSVFGKKKAKKVAVRKNEKSGESKK